AVEEVREVGAGVPLAQLAGGGRDTGDAVPAGQPEQQLRPHRALQVDVQLDLGQLPDERLDIRRDRFLGVVVHAGKLLRPGRGVDAPARDLTGIRQKAPRLVASRKACHSGEGKSKAPRSRFLVSRTALIRRASATSTQLLLFGLV